MAAGAAHVYAYNSCPPVSLLVSPADRYPPTNPGIQLKGKAGAIRSPKSSTLSVLLVPLSRQPAEMPTPHEFTFQLSPSSAPLRAASPNSLLPFLSPVADCPLCILFLCAVTGPSSLLALSPDSCAAALDRDHALPSVATGAMVTPSLEVAECISNPSFVTSVKELEPWCLY